MGVTVKIARNMKTFLSRDAFPSPHPGDFIRQEPAGAKGYNDDVYKVFGLSLGP